MRAIVLSAYGPPSAFELRTLPDPTPGVNAIIPIAARFPLAEARAAHELAEKGAGGKLLLLG